MGKTYDLNVVINGQTVPLTKKFTMKASITASKYLNPNSVSPVLKTQIIISLDETFPGTLAAEDFSVNATSIKDENYVRYLNVLSVDQEAKTLRTMFGGAESGVFKISIRHK